MKDWGGCYPRILVGGDMNARVGEQVEGLCDNYSCGRGRRVYSSMQDQGLHLLNGTCPVLNGAPTFMNTKGQHSNPDHVWVSQDLIDDFENGVANSNIGSDIFYMSYFSFCQQNNTVVLIHDLLKYFKQQLPTFWHSFKIILIVYIWYIFLASLFQECRAIGNAIPQ